MRRLRGGPDGTYGRSIGTLVLVDRLARWVAVDSENGLVLGVTTNSNRDRTTTRLEDGAVVEEFRAEDYGGRMLVSRTALRDGPGGRLRLV